MQRPSVDEVAAWIEKAQGLQQKIGDIVKKYKLEMQKPSVDDIAKWIEAANK